jgi:hypothetical protein
MTPLTREQLHGKSIWYELKSASGCGLCRTHDAPDGGFVAHIIGVSNAAGGLLDVAVAFHRLPPSETKKIQLHHDQSVAALLYSEL